MADEPDEEDFPAAMMRMAKPTLVKDETDAEYAAAEALRLSAVKPPVPRPADDDMPIPLDYEGED